MRNKSAEWVIAFTYECKALGSIPAVATTKKSSAQDEADTFSS